MKDTLSQITRFTKSEKQDIPEPQQESLIKKSIHLLRLRFHDGYYFDIYIVLEKVAELMQKKYPLGGFEYRQMIEAIIRHESDVLGELLQFGVIDISTVPTDEEQEIIHQLLGMRSLSNEQEETILKYFLESDK